MLRFLVQGKTFNVALFQLLILIFNQFSLEAAAQTNNVCDLDYAV